MLMFSVFCITKIGVSSFLGWEEDDWEVKIACWAQMAEYMMIPRGGELWPAFSFGLDLGLVGFCWTWETSTGIEFFLVYKLNS